MAQRSHEEREQAGISMLVMLAALVVLLAALKSAQDLVVPLLISAMVTVLVAPAEHALIRRGWPTWLALSTVLASTLALLAVSFWALNFGLSAFVADLPAYQAGAARLMDHVLALGARAGIDLTHLVRSAEVVGGALESAGSASRAFLVSLAGWVVVLGITGSMLAEAIDLPSKARRLFPERLIERFKALAAELAELMAVLTSGAALTAAADAVVLLALGVPSALLWAGLAFLLSYVPVVGFVVVVVPPTIATLLRFGPGRAAVVLALMVVIHVAATSLIVPRVLRRRVRITPFWTLLSIAVWGWLLGPVGAILAVPLTLSVKFLLDSSPQTEALGGLIEPCRVVGSRAISGRGSAASLG